MIHLTGVPMGTNINPVWGEATLAPGERKRIYDYPVAENYIAFINRFGNVYAIDLVYIFRVDGKDVFGNIDYVVGDVNSPEILDPEILARKSITVDAINQSTSSTIYARVVIRGIVFPDKPPAE